MRWLAFWLLVQAPAVAAEQPAAAQPAAELPAAFLQRCSIDPNRVTANGEAMDPSKVKAEQAEFTLTLAEGGVPLSLTPKNFAPQRSDLLHLTDGVPRLVGDRVVLDFGYEHPLMVLPPKTPAEKPTPFGRLRTEGQLKVDVRRMSFVLEQTMSVQMDWTIPETSRQDLNLRAEGLCVERAVPEAG
jgi:hypothetical protein